MEQALPEKDPAGDKNGGKTVPHRKAKVHSNPAGGCIGARDRAEARVKENAGKEANKNHNH